MTNFLRLGSVPQTTTRIENTPGLKTCFLPLWSGIGGHCSVGTTDIRRFVLSNSVLGSTEINNKYLTMSLVKHMPVVRLTLPVTWTMFITSRFWGSFLFKRFTCHINMVGSRPKIIGATCNYWLTNIWPLLSGCLFSYHSLNITLVGTLARELK